MAGPMRCLSLHSGRGEMEPSQIRCMTRPRAPTTKEMIAIAGIRPTKQQRASPKSREGPTSIAANSLMHREAPPIAAQGNVSTLGIVNALPNSVVVTVRSQSRRRSLARGGGLQHCTPLDARDQFVETPLQDVV